MATLAHANSGRLYSWWWDSHISPKNSKWLQENLTDMDKNVKAMIKLIEEDADSFRKRAEMYYRKRPELMKLVEEFYRAYRALAERYDHATGALRQAHRTMAEAFPDQIPAMVTDESSSGSSDALDGSSHSHAMKGTGFFSQENDGITVKEGLRQLNDMFATGEEALPQNDVTRLSEENEKLKNQITSEAERGEKAQAEVDGLKGTISKLESDKGTAFLQCQLSQEKIFSLEAELSRTQDNLKKLNEEMLVNITNLKGVEEQCHLLEEGCQSLKLEVNLFKETSKTKQEELYMTQEENQRLKNQMTSESERADKAQAEVENLKGTISKLESDKEAAFLQCQISQERIASLEAELTHTQEHLKKLNEEISSNIANLKSFEEQCHLLEEGNQSLQLDLNFFKETTKTKQEELDMRQEENQRLKNQITSVTERADKAQSEVDSLKGTISKLDSDKEVAFFQYQLSQERISSLEAELSRTQEHLKKLNDEMLSNIANLKSVEEQCHLLEEGNESLQVELSLSKEMALTKQEELDMREDELEKLKISLEDEKQRFVQIEMACMSLEELHSRSQEEVRLLTLEVQSGAETLELTKASLEEEVQHLKEENGGLKEENFSNSLKIMNLQDEISLLNESKRRLEGELEIYVEENGSLKEENFSCSMKIMNLQDEISSLNESKKRLEDEVELHTEEKEVLQQEIISMKEDRRDLELRHHELTQQIGALSLNVESLQALVKELRDGNAELKELCKMHEEEKVVHVDNLKHLGNIREKNVVLESSLLNTSVELEELREKVKTLEESSKALEDKVLMHISDKAILVSQIEAIAQNMEKMSEKNTLSENSLSDANIELEGLRVKLQSLEESCQSLHDKESNLLAENNTLVTQVKNTSQSLENSESRFAELECKSMNLEKERGHLLCQNIELQGSLKMEKEQHETLLQFSKSQLATLENQISVLHEKGQLGEKKLEAEFHKAINSHLENFILRRCLHDMTEKSTFLSVECQKYLETSRCKEELILELEKESCKQRNSLTASSQHNEKLLDGVRQVMKMLNIIEDTRSPDDLHFKLILDEIEDLKASVLDAQYDKQHLVLEKSIILTFLQQFKLDMTDLELEKNVLQQKLGVRCEEASVLQREKQELLEINEQLRQNALACNRSEERMNAEMEIMRQKLADLQEADSRLQGEMTKLLVENQSLSIKLFGFHQENDKLEEENNVLLQEVITVEYLYLISYSYGAERVLDLQLLHNELDREISSMNLKLVALEIENVNLKESFTDLEVCRQHLLILEDDVNTTRSVCEQLNTELETGKKLLVQKDMDLLESSHNFKALQDRNSDLCRHIEQLVVDNDDAILVRAQLEKKIFTLLEDTANRDNEIGFLRQVNDTLHKELDQLHEEVEELKNREKHSLFEIQAGADQVESCEVEIATLLNETQIATINVSVFEEKMLELLLKCESLEISSAVQRQALYEELTLRKVFEDESNKKLAALLVENRELKEEVSAFMPLVMSLCDDVASLEECIRSSMKPQQLNHQEKQDTTIVALLHEKSDSGRNAGDGIKMSPGILELQKLHAKINALQQVLMDTMNHFEQERVVSDVNLQDALRKIDVLKSRGVLGQEDLHLKKKEDLGYLQDIDPENHIENFDQVVKDIQLDHVSKSLRHEDGASSHAPSTTESAETKFEMMELWEKLDSNKPVTSDQLEYHQIEVAEEEKNEISSSKLIAKEGKLELPKIITRSHRDWSGNVSERLSSDSQRLAVLQKSVKELKRSMETSELNDSPTNVEFDKIKAQLKEAEKAITHLTNINNRLLKKAEGLSASSDSLDSEQYGEICNISERKSEKKVSERARRGSEKIGRLELELQKIQYILLKLKEEHDYKKAIAAERSTRVILKDYIYGRRDGPKRKKVNCCSCVRPKTKD